MATVIKNNDNTIQQKIKTLDVDWLAEQSRNTKLPGKRIIKANELPKQKSAKREIPISETICDHPEVKVIGTNEHVEGLEIVCNCGQKMVVHFNYDNDDESTE